MQSITECTLCARCDSSIQVVQPVVNRNAPIMVIMDTPSATDDRNGTFMSGKMGEIFDSILEDSGVSWDDIHITGATRCHGAKAPVKDELDACRAYLIQEIFEVKPALIVTMGAGALISMMGRAKGVVALRGTAHHITVEEMDLVVIPTFALGIVFREPGKKDVITADFRKAKQFLAGYDEPLGTDAFIARTLDDVLTIRDTLLASSEFAFDFETTGLNYLATLTADHCAAQVLCASFSGEVGKGQVIPLVGENLTKLWSDSDYPKVVAVLKEILESNVPKIASNGKFDCLWAKHVLGIEVQDFIWDTQLMYAMIHEERPHNLEHMRTLFTQMEYYEGFKNDASYKDKMMEMGYACFPQEVMWQYAAADADCEFRVCQKLRPLLEEESRGIISAFSP